MIIPICLDDGMAFTSLQRPIFLIRCNWDLVMDKLSHPLFYVGCNRIHAMGCNRIDGDLKLGYGWIIIFHSLHYDDVIMTMLASQITSLTVVYSIVYSDVNQRKHQSSASLAFVREIHRGPVNFPHKWPVTRKMFPFDDVIMNMDVIP